MEKLKTGAKVLGEKSHGNNVIPKSFGHAPYFYLHGKAQSLNGFDCVSLNMKAFSNILTTDWFLTKILIDEKEYDGIAFRWMEMSQIKGLICLLNDLEAIENALFKYHCSMADKKIRIGNAYSTDKELIDNNYPEVHEILTRYYHSNKKSTV